MLQRVIPWLLLLATSTAEPVAPAPEAAKPIQVFLFAGQSNMVGADAHARRIDDYPPFVGVAEPQKDVLFSYSVGERTSKGWEELAPLGDTFGPELTFARKVKARLDAPVAIVKCAVGGTTIAIDWHPDAPETGQQLFPRTVDHVRTALEQLRKKGKRYELAAIVWHQGENDMLHPEHQHAYAAGLTRFMRRVREELDAPDVPWFLGEISDKGIWGMDHRRNMQVLREQQRKVLAADPRTHWVPTSHLAFEVMASGQPHYHFGTQGQLQHGEAYADAYLATLDRLDPPEHESFARGLPAREGETVRVFVLLGARNAEGEDAFVARLADQGRLARLRKPQRTVLFRASLAGGLFRTPDWQPLHPLDHLGNFGPELTLGAELERALDDPVALVKVTDSSALLSDWHPEGEGASRPIHDHAVTFVREAMADLASRGHAPELEAVFWIHGENEIYFTPLRNRYAEGLTQLVASLRQRLDAPDLPWFLVEPSPRAPWGEEPIAQMTGSLRELAQSLAGVTSVDTSELPHERIHFGTEGTLRLGQLLARSYLERRSR